MLKIKLVILKYHARLLSITENNKTIYFCNGYISTREELNKIYKDYKNDFYNLESVKDCRKNLITIKEYTRNKKEYIEKLKSTKYPFPHMADDYKQEKQETEYNAKIDNIIEGIKTL